MMEQERQLKPSWQVKFNDVVKTSTARCFDPTSRLQQYIEDQRYKALSERLESFKERHEQGQLLNVTFLRKLLDLARELLQAEEDTPPEETGDRGKTALTKLFMEVRSD
jgi:type I restriction enzyme R subunit